MPSKKKSTRKPSAAKAPSLVQQVYEMVKAKPFDSDYMQNKGAEAVALFPQNEQAAKIVVQEVAEGDKRRVQMWRICRGEKVMSLDVAVDAVGRHLNAALQLIKVELANYC